MDEFFVDISKLSDSARKDFVSKLVSYIQEDGDFNGFIEYQNEPSEWWNWRLVGTDELGNLVFWDHWTDFSVDGIMEKSPEEALADLRKPPESGFPDFDFKIRSGDLEVVRVWLAYNGVSWESGESVLQGPKYKYLCIRGSVVRKVSTERGFGEVDLPEIADLHFSASWSVVDGKEPIRDKIKALEDELEKLRSQL